MDLQILSVPSLEPASAPPRTKLCAESKINGESQEDFGDMLDIDDISC